MKTLKKYFVLLLSLIGITVPLKAQASYTLSCGNFQVEAQKISFDINLKCNEAMEFAQLQPVFILNPEFINGGNLTIEATSLIGGIVSNPNLTGDNLFFFVRKWEQPHLKIPSGETKTILRVTLTNSVDFGTPNLSWAIPPTLRHTKNFKYINGNEIVPCTDQTGLEPILIVTSINDPVNVVKDFELMQNWPNPYNPLTTIEFAIKEKGLTTLKVYDVLGKEVQTLVNQELLTGKYKVPFNGNNLASGIYFYTLTAGQFTETKKMTLIK